MRGWVWSVPVAPARLLALLLVFLLALPGSVYAGVATGSDAEHADDLDHGDNPLFDFYDSGYNFLNQIPSVHSGAIELTPENYAGPVDDGSGIAPYATLPPGTYKGSWFLQALWHDSDGNVKYGGFAYHAATGTYRYSAPYPIERVNLILYPAVFPSDGKYFSYITLFFGDTHLNILSSYYYQTFQRLNVNSVSSPNTLIPTKYYNRFSNGFGIANAPISISNNPSRIDFIYVLDYKNYPQKILDIDRATIDFWPGGTISDDDLIESNNPNVGPMSSADVQQSIANSVSQLPGALTEMSGQLENIGNTLRDIITTISNQLNALWNQLYNYMHVPLMAQIQDSTDQIVNAIEDINLDFTDFSEQIIANDNKLHQEQLDNDNKNADQIMNGYDNSGMESTNQKLGDSLSEYESQEAELLGSVSGHINDFEYTNPFEQFVNPLGDCSYFLTGLYADLGHLNIPIAFSLTLSIGLICIGWYRFRGG